MTEQKKNNLEIVVECHECQDCYTLEDWKKYSMNDSGTRGDLKLEAEDPEEVIDDVMMDCPGCDTPVYLSDGNIC
jgi:hypothetical protein